jgi:hypothetical protein
MNSVCERFLGSVRRESLDHLVIVSERHLHHVLAEYALSYFNAARPHQGIGQRMSADFDAERGRELRTWVTMPRRRVGLELARMRRTNFA